MRFEIVTIFPEIFSSYFSESILKRAQIAGLISIKIHNLRDFTTDKHKTVDDTPCGGGAGMVMKVEPIYKSVKFIKSLKFVRSKKKTRIILFSAKGKKYTQKDVRRFAKYDNLILICGRYEGVDERVTKYIADEEISIGDYVLTGGEIPAMIVVDSVSRLIPGVLGNPKSLDNESFSMGVHLRRASADAKFSCEIEDFEKICEYPQYTKPEVFNKWKVPKVLLSGNHKEIENWRKLFSRGEASTKKKQ
jgi:tRNA (guanine37-N1)-methyltransferase